MKQVIILLSFVCALGATTHAQVTQLNGNNSLQPIMPFNNHFGLLKGIDKSLWITDATPAGAAKLSQEILYEWGGVMYNNKFIFSGSTVTTGVELFISDGTESGTMLLKDINPGTESSTPDEDMVVYNGYVYFTATAPGVGRELWRTDGTPAGTVMVSDIYPGPGSSNLPGKYDLFVAGNYMLLKVATINEGIELWRSNGTDAGTMLLKDINPGNAGSEAFAFTLYNNMVLFSAKTAGNGVELWKTDGTTAGTQLVKDINPGTGSSLNYLFIFQHNNKAYFTANNGTNGDEIWVTDGTTANTKMVKDIQPGPIGSSVFLYNAIKLPNKFIFAAYTTDLDFELWESDGTPNGTKLFKEMGPGMESGGIYLFAPWDYASPNQQTLFNGKFFFMTSMPSTGSELWMSDGTDAGTVKVKTINALDNQGLDDFGYIYTSSGMYFIANDEAHGYELWKTNGTAAGTGLVADVNPGNASADIIFSFFMVNDKILFEADNGDHQFFDDLYKIDADERPLPVRLFNFSVRAHNDDAILQWTTSQEINTKSFTIERSLDGVVFSSIGSVQAAGYSVASKSYQLTDKNVMQVARNVIYYRLVTIDKDEQKTISSTIMLHVAKKDWQVKMLGNPVSNTLTAQMIGAGNAAKLYIYDMAGRVVAPAIVGTNGIVNISVEQLRSGTYMLVAEKDGDRKTVPFVKQ